MQTLKAKLVSVQALTHDTSYFVFSEVNGSPLNFQAGQYLILQVQDGKEGKASRSYSLASSPNGSSEFAFIIRLLPDGRGSNYLKSLSPGDEVEFMGPFGHFVVKDDAKDILMIATGTGLAPFVSMIPELFKASQKPKIRLYFGLRFEEDIFYKEKLEAWVKEHPEFDCYLTVSRPTENWSGLRGRVTEHLEHAHLDPQNTHVYICGNGEMVKSVKEFLEAKGFPKEAIHLELFSPIVARI